MSKSTQIDFGNTVVCDICSDDHTDRDVAGGMLFGSHGVCPECTERMMPNIIEYKEEYAIVDKANPGESFRQFSLRMRGGNNVGTITIISRQDS